jgi:hypothetical protein
MKLTKETIDACMTDGSSYTVVSIHYLHVPRPLKSGWKKRMVGTEISESDYQKALEGRKIFKMHFKDMNKDSEQTTLTL